MSSVNVRDLRNHGGEVLDRVAAGENLIVIRSGTPVAQLSPLPRKGLSADELIARHRLLPPVDPASLRRDIDEILDTSL
jgi:prevent-host-death family protein